jgi:hypothetical protein
VSRPVKSAAGTGQPDRDYRSEIHATISRNAAQPTVFSNTRHFRDYPFHTIAELSDLVVPGRLLSTTMPAWFERT